MKKYIYILFVSFTLGSCSGGTSDEGREDTNLNPTTPGLISPTNNLLCVDATLNFSWDAATDADGDVGCIQIVRESTQKVAHSHQCRLRMQDLIMSDDYGRARIERAAERMAETSRPIEPKQPGGEVRDAPHKRLLNQPEEAEIQHR